MVGARVLGQIKAATQPPSLQISGPEYHASHAGLHEGPSAHGTRFQGHKQRALVEPPVAQNPGGLTQGDQFGMPERVLIGFTPVATVTDAVPLVIKNDCSNGYFSVSARFIRTGDQHLHPAHPLPLIVQRPSPLVPVIHP